MRILQLWTLYDAYLDAFYGAHQDLGAASHAQQLQAVLDDSFGWPPAVARRLSERGHDVQVVIGNCQPLQRAWARENGVGFDDRSWNTRIAAEQIRRFRPDVLWVGSSFQYFGSFLREVREHCGRVVAWTAAPLPSTLDLRSIDCMVTSHANFQSTFRQRGVRAERMLPCFEPRVREELGEIERDIEIGFVGSLTWAHVDRIRMLRSVAATGDLRLWTAGMSPFARSALRPAFWRAWWLARPLLAGRLPEVYGRDMYRVLARTRSTVNAHIGVAGGLAGNMRMFEATGMGSLLFTEDMPNLPELFEPGVEVVPYRDAKDLCMRIRSYAERPDEAAAIAERGQRRTLRDYGTPARAREVEALFADLLGVSALTSAAGPAAVARS